VVQERYTLGGTGEVYPGWYIGYTLEWYIGVYPGWYASLLHPGMPPTYTPWVYHHIHPYRVHMQQRGAAGYVQGDEALGSKEE